MLISLTIHTTPPITYTTQTGRLTGIGTIRRPLSGNGQTGENANMDVTLDNADGILTATFADPPLRVPADVTLDGSTLFSGTVTAVTVADAITVELQA